MFVLKKKSFILSIKEDLLGRVLIAIYFIQRFATFWILNLNFLLN